MRDLVPPTPLLALPELGAVHAKLENLQITGSFKVRGAAARMAGLEGGAKAAGVVACSSGNHGRAVAWVAARRGLPAVICVPDWVDPVKLAAIRAEGAEAVLVGSTYDEAAERAGELARERGLTLVHPFDDPEVAAGQGTVALEIMDALPDVGTVVMPLSGGGLAGGIAYALKRRGLDVRVVAASARRARVMWASLQEGRPVQLPEEDTLANALTGGIELDNRVTFDLVRTHVDAHVLVEEDAIARAMVWAWTERGLVVEGGGAVALAALLEGAVEADDARPVAVVLSGGNVALERLQKLLEAAPLN